MGRYGRGAWGGACGRTGVPAGRPPLPWGLYIAERTLRVRLFLWGGRHGEGGCGVAGGGFMGHEPQRGQDARATVPCPYNAGRMPAPRCLAPTTRAGCPRHGALPIQRGQDAHATAPCPYNAGRMPTPRALPTPRRAGRRICLTPAEMMT
jgi:hypothetical protein